MNKKKAIQISRIVISVTFILSAITKLLSLHFFDDLVAEVFLGKGYENETGGVPVGLQFFSRLIIAGEILLGAAVLQRKYLKKIVLPTIMAMLIGFTIHLFATSFGIMARGRTAYDAFFDGNCGCFGDIIPMNNFESILKNLLVFALTYYVWRNYKYKKELRFRAWVMPIVIGSVTFFTLLLTIKAPVERTQKFKEFTSTIEKPVEMELVEDTLVTETDTAETVVEEEKEEKEPETAVEEVQTKPKPTSCFLKDYTVFSNGNTNLCEGEKLVCMFDLNCGHCQESYKDLVGMYDAAKFPDTYLLLFGQEQGLNYFFNQAGGQHPYARMEDYTEFKRILQGKSFPRILVLKEGKIQKEWDLDTYKKESMAEYFEVELKEEEDSSPDGLW